MDDVFRRYLEALEKTQWLPSEDLAEYQRGLLRELVRHAQSECPFYAERLSCLFTGSGIDLSRWSDVPILTRAEATADSNTMQARRLPEMLGNFSSVMTSGSGGAALNFFANSPARIR